MLELRQNCENCNKTLPPNSTEAMICTYECTFCKDCVDNVLQNVCPNCSGGFEKRPIRPKIELESNPPTDIVVYKPVIMEKFQILLEKYVNILPNER
ncbi:DUF1272 domain-containing protein [Ulvibacter antarcticus]|uniref:RING-type domain-containing protein n=1 Tax=Ulvibacter antarcticus TaxID=442714 RepID=A0A3L9YCC0_9FLAO|nr:DUF1272 domain-containing protein [Ulvibacter antarcticus]RMA58014.1 hypothetical protein BXY75_2822 [Ulvibacter antarcticus]